MAAFNFPNSPSVNDIHTENGVSWKWNGTIWKRIGSAYTDATNLHVTGLSTFVGNAQFDANVSIGGTLTYEDVKNVDSVGIVTARDKINMTQGYQLGWLSGSTNRARIHGDSGSNFIVETGASNSERLRIDSSGRLLLGTTTEGQGDADNLTIRDSGNCGITIRSSDVGWGVINFSDATSGAGEYDGFINYSQQNRFLKFGTASLERLRIDSSGRILQGSSAGRNTALMAAQPTYQLEGVGSNASNFGIFCNSNASAAGGLIFGKTRGSAVGGTTVVAANDSLGHISFEGSDGSAQRVGVRITAAVDGTPGSSDMPGRLMFFTTPDGSATEAERLRIDSQGNVGINQTNPAAYGKFVVNGTGNVISLRASSGAGNLAFFEGGTGRFYIKTLNGSDGLSFVDGDNSSERMRITAAGTAEFYGGEGGTDAIKVQSEGGGAGLYFSNFQGITDTGDSTRLGVGKNDNALIWMNASGSQVGCLAYGTTDAVPLVFSTANTERLRITAAGNVGIGTNNVDSPLEVVGTGPSLVTIHHGDGGTNDEARIMLGALPNNPPDNRGAGIAAVNNGAGHDLTIKTSSSHAAGPTEKVRITAAGRVGINETSPDGELHIKGSNPVIYIEGTSGSGLQHRIRSTGGNSDSLQFNSNNLYYNANAHYFRNAAESAEYLRIDSSGLVMMGTTSPGFGAYGDALTIYKANHVGLTLRTATNKDAAIYFADSASGNGRYAGFIDYSHTNNYLRFGTNESERLRIQSDGNVGIARTINNYQTSNIGSIWNLSVNRESFAYPGAGTAAGGLNKSLNVDNQYAVSTFRSTQQNYNGTAQWYDVALFNAWDFTGKIVIQSGGTFTGDEIVIDIVSSYNSALGNSRSGPYMEVRRTEGHNGDRFTKVRVGCHNSARSNVYIQVYYDGNATHNANSWITSTVFDYGSGYGCAQNRAYARWQAASTINETWKELDIDSQHQNYFNTSTTPAFMAYRHDDSGQQGSGTLVYNTQLNDRGGDNYNTSNGRYTAPSDGMYYVHANVQLYGSGSGGKHCEFQKNGADIFSGGTSAPWYDEPAGNHHNIYMFGVFSLATGDYLSVHRNGSTRGMQCAFCGFLIR